MTGKKEVVIPFLAPMIGRAGEMAGKRLEGIFNRCVVEEVNTEKEGEIRLTLRDTTTIAGILVFNTIDSLGADGRVYRVPAITMIYPSGQQEIIWNG